MANWLLSPVDHEAEVWKTYLVQRIVVQAGSEREARKQVARASLGTAVPEKAPPNPWLDPALTLCEQVEESDPDQGSGS